LMNVRAGGGREFRVPLQERQAFSVTIVVDGVEKKFYVAGGNLLRKDFRRKQRRKNQRKKKSPEEIFRHA